MANSAEDIVYNAIKTLASGSVYPDVAPLGAARPFIVFQAVGGESTNYMSNTDNLQNARVQVSVWADDRLTAVSLIQGVIAALTPAPIFATSRGAPVSTWEFDTKLYGSRLDFSIWWNN
ncbi:DUF3168 domain-containing protein [Burkholderia pseudomallei]|uniref:DUF3168 domain-containing protein n=1 Tax=Burkholderia pseudomallei TaxID=28450 RepID=UPI000A1A2668|nr:DUF3168 domain-containing protein [Burkholderia pseudomallei]ARL25489.1 hypothetical protein BOC47_24265 [Burkholderia pseudomallei]ARL77601.1 hypothetical protein BOC54_37025 [Burkholderia pseudomallei]ARL84207.1 hypothetical protein BOC55_35350 [Burkholderia pseudomallei]